jgi:uncharacterized protein (TIGR00156 family)
MGGKGAGRQTARALVTIPPIWGNMRQIEAPDRPECSVSTAASVGQADRAGDMSEKTASARARRSSLIGLLGCIAVLVAAGGAARAEYVGPNAGVRTVQQIKAAAVDGQTVELRGTLARKTGPDLFVFKDQTGEIPVKIAPRVVPRAQIKADTPIELRGQIETGWQTGARIEAEDVIVLPQAK